MNSALRSDLSSTISDGLRKVPFLPKTVSRCLLHFIKLIESTIARQELDIRYIHSDTNERDTDPIHGLLGTTDTWRKEIYKGYDI